MPNGDKIQKAQKVILGSRQKGISDESTRAFLLGKGLTEPEIESAFSVAPPVQKEPAAVTLMRMTQQPPPAAPPAPKAPGITDLGEAVKQEITEIATAPPAEKPQPGFEMGTLTTGLTATDVDVNKSRVKYDYFGAPGQLLGNVWNSLNPTLKGIVNTPAFLTSAVGAVIESPISGIKRAAEIATGQEIRTPVEVFTDKVNESVWEPASKALSTEVIDRFVPQIALPETGGISDPNAWFAGVGQGLGQLMQVYATKGKNLAPYAVSFLNSYGMGLEGARNAGLSEKDARNFAGTIGAIVGFMDAKLGVENFVSGIAKKQGAKELMTPAISEALTDFANGGMTPEALNQAATTFTKGLRELTKDVFVTGSKQAVLEGADETLQAVMETAAKNIYNYNAQGTVGQGKFGDVFTLRPEDIPAGSGLQPGFQSQVIPDILFEGAIGGIIGGSMGSLGPIATRTDFAPTLFGQMSKAVATGSDTQFEQMLNASLQAAVTENKIPEYRAAQAKQDISAMRRVAKLTQGLQDETGEKRFSYFRAIQATDDARNYLKSSLMDAYEDATTQAEVDMLEANPNFQKAKITLGILEGTELSAEGIENANGVKIPGLKTLPDGRISTAETRGKAGLIPLAAKKSEAVPDFAPEVERIYAESIREPEVQVVTPAVETEVQQAPEKVEELPEVSLQVEQVAQPRNLTQQLTEIADISGAPIVANAVRNLATALDAGLPAIEAHNQATGQEENYAEILQAATDAQAAITAAAASVSRGAANALIQKAKKSGAAWTTQLGKALTMLPKVKAKAVAPQVSRVVAEIKSKPLTRVEGLGMGANQAEGVYVSTEAGNRYAAPGAEAVRVDVNISNPLVVENDPGLIELRTMLLNENRAAFTEFDFDEFEIPRKQRLSIDDLSSSGIKKLAGIVTQSLQSQGYDSIYFPQTATQEGELVIFDRAAVSEKKAAPKIKEIKSKKKTVRPPRSSGILIESLRDAVAEYLYAGIRFTPGSFDAYIPAQVQKEMRIAFHLTKKDGGTKFDDFAAMLHERGLAGTGRDEQATQQEIADEIISFMNQPGGVRNAAKRYLDARLEEQGQPAITENPADEILYQYGLFDELGEIDDTPDAADKLSAAAQVALDLGITGADEIEAISDILESDADDQRFAQRVERVFDIWGLLNSDGSMNWKEAATRLGDESNLLDGFTDDIMAIYGNVDIAHLKELFTEFANQYERNRTSGAIEPILLGEDAETADTGIRPAEGEVDGNGEDIAAVEPAATEEAGQTEEVAEIVEQPAPEPPADVQKQIVNRSPKTKSVGRRLRRLIDRLKRTFPGVEVVTDIAEIDAALDRIAAENPVVTEIRTSKGIAGFVYDGKIYIDPRLADESTPIHEFGHIWNDIAKKNFPVLYKRGRELMRGSSYEQYVRRIYAPQIAQLRAEGKTEAEVEDFVLDEALATAIGERGKRMIGEPLKRFGNFFTQLWERIKGFFGANTLLEKMTPEQIANMNMNQFVDATVRRITNGYALTEQDLTEAQQKKTESLEPEKWESAVAVIATAQRMEADGMDSDAIAEATGWRRDKEGYWEQVGEAKSPAEITQQTFQEVSELSPETQQNTAAMSAVKFQLMPGTMDADMVVDDNDMPSNAETARLNSADRLLDWVQNNLTGTPTQDAQTIFDTFSRWVYALQRIGGDTYEKRPNAAGIRTSEWQDIYNSFSDLTVLEEAAAYVLDPDNYTLPAGREQITVMVGTTPTVIDNPYQKIAGAIFGRAIDGVPNKYGNLLDAYAKFHAQNLTHATSGQRLWTRNTGDGSAKARTLSGMVQRRRGAGPTGTLRSKVRTWLHGVANLNTLGKAYFAANTYGREVLSNKFNEAVRRYAPIFSAGSHALQRAADAARNLSTFRGTATWRTVDKMPVTAMVWNPASESYEEREIQLSVAEAISLVMIYDTQLASYGESSVIIKDTKNKGGVAYGEKTIGRKGQTEIYFGFADNTEVERLRKDIEANAEYKAAYDEIKSAFNDTQRFDAIQELYERITGKPLERVTSATGAGEYFQLLSASTESDSVGSATGNKTRFIDSISVLQERVGAGSAVQLVDAVSALHRYLKKTDDFLKNAETVVNLAVFLDDYGKDIQRELGDEGKQLVEVLQKRFLEAMNDYRAYLSAMPDGYMDKITNFLTRNFTLTRFAYNLALPMKQSATYLMSFGLGIVDDKYLAKALPFISAETIRTYFAQLPMVNTGSRIEDRVGQRNFFDLVQRIDQNPHASEIYNRIVGLYTADTEAAQTLRQMAASGFVDEDNSKFDLIRRMLDEYGLYGTRRMDRAVIAAQYYAAELQVLGETGKTDPATLTDDERRRVADLATELMKATNVMYDVGERSAMQLSRSPWDRMLGVFTGQSQRMGNTVLQNYYDYRDGVPSAGRRLAASATNMIFVNALAMTVIDILIGAIRKFIAGREDEDERTAKEVALRTLNNMLGMRPGLATSTVEAFISRVDAMPWESETFSSVGIDAVESTYNNLYKVFEQLTNDKKFRRGGGYAGIAEESLKVAMQAMETAGILPSEIRRIFEGQVIENIADEKKKK